MSLRLAHLGLLTLLLFVLAGCGGADKRAAVSGKVVVEGKDLKLDGPYPFEVTFRSDDASDPKHAGRSFSAQVEPDGAFVLQGDDGKGVPLANYKITVRSTAYGDPAVVKKATPPWVKAVKDQNKTPLHFDLNSEGNVRVVIDVIKKTVQRQ